MWHLSLNRQQIGNVGVSEEEAIKMEGEEMKVSGLRAQKKRLGQIL